MRREDAEGHSSPILRATGPDATRSLNHAKQLIIKHHCNILEWRTSVSRNRSTVVDEYHLSLSVCDSSSVFPDRLVTEMHGRVGDRLVYMLTIVLRCL